VIGQNVETVLRTSRGETQSFSLKVVGISPDRQAVIQVSLTDRIAMKNWWFNSTNIVEREGYDSVTIRSLPVLDRQNHELITLMPGITPPELSSDPFNTAIPIPKTEADARGGRDNLTPSCS